MNIRALAASVVCILSGSVHALTINSEATDVGSVDTLLGEIVDVQSFSGPSNEDKQAQWASDVLGFTVTFESKPSENLGPSMYQVDGAGNESLFAFDFGVANIEYYLVKTGNVSDDGNRIFLFDNLDKLQWAVVDLTDMGFTNTVNVLGLSHVTAFDSGEITTRTIPEPATPLLLGLGLLALSVCRKRFK